MTAPRDPDQLIHAYFDEGPDELPDPVYDAVRDRIEQTRQRAGIGLWRTAFMSKTVQYGVVAAAAAVVLIIGSNLLGSGNPSPGGEPSAPVAPSEAAQSAKPASAADQIWRHCERSATWPSSCPILPEGPFAWFKPIGPEDQYNDGPAVTVTIPASGWTCRPGVPCALFKGEVSGLEQPGDLPESALVVVSTTAGIFVYEDPCQWQYNLPDPPATTADEIAAALAAQPSRDATDPVDVTVGGYPGKMVTVHVPDNADFAECFRGAYASYTLGNFDAEGTIPWRTHQGPGQIDTFWIVEVDGGIVILDAIYRADTPAGNIEEMRAIVESATFPVP